MSKSSSFILTFFLLPYHFEMCFSYVFLKEVMLVPSKAWDKNILDYLLLACLPVLDVLLALSTYLSFLLYAY